MDADTHDVSDVELDGPDSCRRKSKATKRSTSVLATAITALLVTLVGGLTGATYFFKGYPDAFGRKTQEEPEITPEQARAALLKLNSLPRYLSGENDPIRLDLKTGAVTRINDPVATIGRFFSCNLKEKTWQMSFSITGATPKMNFATGAHGKFEFQPDGTWKAIEGIDYIT